MVTKQTCFGCKKKPSTKPNYNGRSYCDNCFMRMIEKRIRKDLRINKKIQGKEVSLFNDNSKEYKISRIFLKNIFGERLKINPVKKIDTKTIIPSNLDREVKAYMELYLENKDEKQRKTTILQNILEEELFEICRIEQIPKGKPEEINEFIENIEKTYPGTKFAMAKSFEKIFS